MNKRVNKYIFLMLGVSLVLILCGCTVPEYTLEAGSIPTAAELVGDESAEFAHGFNAELFRTLGTHSVTVRVNGKKKRIKVNVIDTTAPTVEAGEINILVGDGIAWKKQVKLSDNSDGEIKLSVDSSAVDTSRAGTYTVYFTATDPSGNETRVSATVTVSTFKVTEEMLNTELDRVIEQIIKDGMSTEDKCRAVYSYLQKKIIYASTAETDDYVYAAYMALFSSGTGDCYSFFSASKAFFERLGIENLDLSRTEGVGNGSHYWNLVNLGTSGSPLWYHFDSSPLTGEYSVSGCLLTDAQIEAYDAWRAGENYRTYDKTLYPASASVILTDIPELAPYLK